MKLCTCFLSFIFLLSLTCTNKPLKQSIRSYFSFRDMVSAPMCGVSGQGLWHWTCNGGGGEFKSYQMCYYIAVLGKAAYTHATCPGVTIAVF